MKQKALYLFLTWLVTASLALGQNVRLYDPVPQNPPPGQNSVYVVNPAIVGPTLDISMPPNHKVLVWNIWTKSQIKTYPGGWKYIDDWYLYRDDPNWITRRNAFVRNTYRADVPNTNIAVTGNGVTGTLLTRFETWFLRTEGWLAVHALNAPRFTNAELAGLQNKVYGGTILDGKATAQDLRTHGWKYFESRSLGNRVFNNETEVYAIPNGDQFKGYIGGAPYQGEYIYDAIRPTYDQGVQAANSAVNQLPHGLFIDQISEAFNHANAVPEFSSGNLGYNARIKELYPNKFNFLNYGENVRLRLPNEGFNYVHPSYKHYYIGNARKTFSGEDDPFYQIRANGKSFHSIGGEKLAQYYPDDPGDPDFAIRTLIKLEVNLRQDPTRKPILFMWPWLENPSGDGSMDKWGSTIYNLYTTQPGGTVRYLAGGIPDPISIELVWLLYTIDGRGGLNWADTNNHIDDPNKVGASFDPSHTQWIPNSGQAPSFPYTPDGQPSRPRFPYLGYDAGFHGFRKAAKVIAHHGTDEISSTHATWSVNGTTYTPPEDGTGLLVTAYNRRPIVKIVNGGGKQSVVACDLFCAPNAIKTITVQLGGGRTVNVPMQGNAVHVVLINGTSGGGGVVTPPPTGNTPSAYTMPDMALTYYLNNDEINEHTGYLNEFKQAAQDNGAHPEIKVGAALSQFWHNWETSPGVWNGGRAAQLQGIMNWAQSNGLKMGFRPVPLRNHHEKGGFYTDDQCQRTWDGNISIGLVRSVPHYEYSVQALQSGGLNDQGNPAVKQYNFVKHLANLYKPYYQSGSLTYALIGGGQNEEAQFAGDLGANPPLWGDFHEVVRQGFIARNGLSQGTQLPGVNSNNAWDALTQSQNRLFTNYRTYTLANYLLLQAVAIYSELPGLPLFVDVGQCMEGGGLYVGSWNTAEILSIVRTGLASRFPGVTVRVYLKKNPAPSYNMEFDGAFTSAHSITASDPNAPSATEQDYYTVSQAGSGGLVDGSENAYAMAQKAVAAYKGAGGQHITFLAQCQDQNGGAYPGAAWAMAKETARQYARMDRSSGRKTGAPVSTYILQPDTYLNNPGAFKDNLRSWWESIGKGRFQYVKPSN